MVAETGTAGKPGKEFLGYIHGFRGFAITAVVATHIAAALDWTNASPIAQNAVHAIIRNGTLPFLFIAGFLFQHLSARFRYRKYLATKLKNVIVPYLIVSIPSLANQIVRRIGYFAEIPRGDWLAVVARTADALLSGGHMPTPLWFIPAISLFYLSAPLFIAIDRRPVLYWITPVLMIVAMFMHRPLFHGLVWQSALYCLPAYLSGCWASHYREPLLAWLGERRRLMAGVFFALIAVELFVLKRSGPIFSARPFSTERGIVDIDMPAKLIASLAVLELLRAREDRLPRWLFALATTSFGIFFVHQYVIDAICAVARRSPYPIEHRGIPTFLVLWVLAVVASHLIVRLVQRIAGRHSRWIIGA